MNNDDIGFLLARAQISRLPPTDRANLAAAAVKHGVSSFDQPMWIVKQVNKHGSVSAALAYL